ncbi:hypothetical protein [Natronincola ferrireducens]|uniref:hypothetical protein n=1 Tax=Natronincola ferrireducens TaxID=393762 RepID=UPI00159FDB38|nr:hypothetical protein [Natronincola ferrireducens]
MDSVYEEFRDLCQGSKDKLDNMIKIMDDYLGLSRRAFYEFEKLEFRKINDEIDNT